MSIFWFPQRKRRLFIYLAFLLVTLLVFLAVSRHQGHRNTVGDHDDDDDAAAIYLRSNGRQKEYIDKKGMHVVVGK